MANTSTPRGSRFNGLFNNAVGGTVDLYENGVKVGSFSNTATTITSTTVTQTATTAVLPQAVTIGGIAYTFPADNGDAGEQLQTDGSGALTWEASGV